MQLSCSQVLWTRLFSLTLCQMVFRKKALVLGCGISNGNIASYVCLCSEMVLWLTYTTTKQCESLDPFGWALAIMFKLRVAELTQLDSLHTEVYISGGTLSTNCFTSDLMKVLSMRHVYQKGIKDVFNLIEKSPDLYFCIAGARESCHTRRLIEMTFLCYTKRMGWE